MSMTDDRPILCPICYRLYVAAGSAACSECQALSEFDNEKIVKRINEIHAWMNDIDTNAEKPSVGVLNYYEMLLVEAGRRNIQLYMYDGVDDCCQVIATIDSLFAVNPLFFQTLEVTKAEAATLLKRKCHIDSKYGFIVIDKGWEHRQSLIDTIKFVVNEGSLKDGLLDSGKKYVAGAGAARYIDSSLAYLADLATDDPFAILATLWGYTLTQVRKVRALKA